MPFDHAIDDVEALRAIYRAPHPVTRSKVIDRIDDAAAAFIARSPFVVLATTSAGRTDASPRGGPPGFVRVLDEGRLAFGDLNGNNLLDSFTHLVEEPSASLIFLVPGLGETLRVTGRATLTTDPAVREATAVDGVVPKVAVGIDVERCFLHCSKAFLRSKLWDPTSWPAAEDRPRIGELVVAHTGLDVDPALVEADLAAGAAATLWVTGGDVDPPTDA